MERADRAVIDELGMAELPRIVDVLHRRHHGRVTLIDVGGDCMIRYGRLNVANMSYLPVILHFMRINDDVLTLEGNVSIPYVYRDRCRFMIRLDGVDYPADLYDAGLDKRDERGRKYELCTAFRCDIDLGTFEAKGGAAYSRPEDERNDELGVTFCLITDGIESECNKINSMRFMPVADVLLRQYAVLDSWIARIEGNIVDRTNLAVIDKRVNDIIRERNAAVCELGRKYGLPINDLYAYMLTEGAGYKHTDPVHFVHESDAFIAKRVAAAIADAERTM